MISTTKAIVLSTIKYKDSSLIVTCYTKNHGVQAYILHHILKSKKGKINPAYFQVLSQLELQVSYKSNQTLQKISEVKLQHSYTSLQTNIYKSTVALFLAEILHNCLKEEEENHDLYNYLEASLLWYDIHDFNANFHLLFLIKLSQHLGIYPDEHILQQHFFYYEKNQVKIDALKLLFGVNFDDLHHIKYSAQMRQDILNEILQYFNVHLGVFKQPKSLKILHDIFN
ncbi:MAG: DNA repair protein RecO [Flavobacteriaceae bacterium]